MASLLRIGGALLCAVGMFSMVTVSGEERATEEGVREKAGRETETPRLRRIAEIHAALRKPITANFVDVPLEKALFAISQMISVSIVVDRQTCLNEGMTLDSNVTLEVKGISAASVLRLMLEPLAMDHIIRHEVLMITSAGRAAETLDTEIYDVADLVAVGSEKDHGVGQSEAFAGLMDAITTIVQYESWQEVGGAGWIRPLRSGGLEVLIVRQTRSAHDDIADLLARLRAARRDASKRQGVKTPEAKAVSSTRR